MDTGRGREREGEGGRKQFTMGICENPLPMEQLTMGTQWRSSLWEFTQWSSSLRAPVRLAGSLLGW